ncbi:MAG TPA: hypothetical protein VJP78_05665 [Thermoleophilia bacterium]|nr:hypothetical protein [Thermoleophilia bacterium]
MAGKLNFVGNCRTTAMGIMPHTDIGRALELSLGLDIPFWPQLPHVSYYEDMYVQASEHFPGISVDLENQRISFDTARFNDELDAYLQNMEDTSVFRLTEKYAAVYHRFLAEDLTGYAAIRGQLIGPVSFGFKVCDENNVPIIYNEAVRWLLFDFLSRKINVQYAELKKKNENAFVWLDEPGLGWVFSGLSGYGDTVAKREYGEFLESLSGPGALHLCADVNLPYLLGMGTVILSFDAYQAGTMPRGYAESLRDFLKRGGIVSWGIVPTDSASLAGETPESLAGRLLDYWGVVSANTDITMEEMAEQALIAPARCCLKNIGNVGATGETASKEAVSCPVQPEEHLVETAFTYLKEISGALRDRLDTA